MTTQDTVATSERISIIYYPETVFGVADTGTPTYQAVEAVSEGLKQQASHQKSRTLVDDRMVKQLIRSDVQAGGPTEHELQYGAYDDWFAAAFMTASWAAAVSVTVADAVLTADAGPGTVTITTTAGTFSGFSAGCWVKLSDLTTASNKTFAKIITVAAKVLTLRLANADQDFAAPLTTQACKIVQGAQITNGTAFTSFSLEVGFTDLSNEIKQFLGSAIDKMTLGIETESIPNLSFEWLAKNEDSITATLGDGTPDAASTNDILNTVDHIYRVLEGKTTDLTNLDCTQFSFSLMNNLRARKRLGVLGATSLGLGVGSSEGTLRQHYTTKALMDKKIDDVETGLAVILNDGGLSAYGNCYVLEQPSIKYTDGARVAGGQDSDILADMSYESFKDPTEEIIVRLQRWTSAEANDTP